MPGQHLKLKPVGDVCGKRRIHSQAEAEGRAAVQRQRDGDMHGCRLVAYHCERCAAWHTGHRS